MADIIRTNAFARPVYFAFGCPPALMEGMDGHLQIHGFVWKLMPGESDTVNLSATLPLLMDAGNFTHVTNVIDQDMPRVSGMLQNYRVAFLRVTIQAAGADDNRTAREALAAMREFVPEEAVPMPETLRSSIAALESRLEGQ